MLGRVCNEELVKRITGGGRLFVLEEASRGGDVSIVELKLLIL